MKLLVDYLGRAVRLTDERLAHILGHPEMAKLETAIVQTLLEPQVVVQSRTDPAVRLYHRGQTTEEFGEKWLCVLVKYSADDAFVITAHLTDKVKSGEILWPNP